MTQVAIVLWGQAGWDRAAEGLAGAGRRLAKELDAQLLAVVVGPGEALSGAEAVADRVMVAAQAELAEYQPGAYLAAIQQMLEGQELRAVLLGNDTYSQELAPRLAHRLGGAAMADCQAVTAADGNIRATRSAYGGKALAVYELRKDPAVLWVRARAMDPAEAGGGCQAENVQVELPAARLRIVERRQESQEGVRLEDAQVVVSGGRGVGGAEPFEEMLAPLAETLHAAQGASRAACDAGWVPPGWQVGQTGKKVAPELYLAIAISGASQHLLGMGDSKIIAAINTDADAPIFKHCSFGIVEDYKNVVPPLTEKLRALAG